MNPEARVTRRCNGLRTVGISQIRIRSLLALSPTLESAVKTLKEPGTVEAVDISSWVGWYRQAVVYNREFSLTLT